MTAKPTPNQVRILSASWIVDNHTVQLGDRLDTVHYLTLKGLNSKKHTSRKQAKNRIRHHREAFSNEHNNSTICFRVHCQLNRANAYNIDRHKATIQQTVELKVAQRVATISKQESSHISTSIVSLHGIHFIHVMTEVSYKRSSLRLVSIMSRRFRAIM